MTRIISIALVAAFLVFAAIAHAQTAPVAEGQGEIQGLNFAANTMVINGYDYDVDINVDVEINGSYGAFTMLEEGMLIEFSFLHFDDGVRRVVEIFEVDAVEQY